MPILYCALYIAAIGTAFRYIGNAYPRRWFRPERFPYRCAAWEQNGKIYRRLGVHRWKDRLPDMSKIDRRMYRKAVDTHRNPENLKRLAEESCVAECVHYQLMAASVPVIRICPGIGGWIIWALCILINGIFVLIQRYNRPRFLNALKRLSGEPVQSRG